ncbi:MAG: hypothetical protein AAFU41_01925 [Pseudomonadota bacterium]
MRILGLLGLISVVSAGPVLAQSVDFGDDSSQWSNDGECDDPRFEGPGMTATPLLDEDILSDATDCRTAFEAGLLVLRGEGPADLVINGVNFGNDLGQWSNDGECDDPRFEGAGMTTTPLLHDDLMRDATDCSTAFLAGDLRLVGIGKGGHINFGDDTSDWANDGECDDMRFEGPGMTTTPLLADDILHDASDCRNAYTAGLLTLAGE